MRGIVKTVRSDRGYFFVTPEDGGDDHFGHIRDLDRMIPFDDSLKGKVVEFNSVRGDRGLKAVDVRPAGGR